MAYIAPDPRTLWKALHKSRVYECAIRGRRRRPGNVVGYCLNRNIYIDPRHDTISTLLHELMHRQYPKWGERRVEAAARDIEGRMRESTRRRWWRGYCRLRRRHAPLDVLD